MRTVVIDPGHGGHDPGALGPNKERESDVALSVGSLLYDRLMAAGLDARMTRTSDEFLPLHSRAAVANMANADLFVSIHCNSGPPGQGRGFEVWTSPGQTRSDAAATDLFNAYHLEFPELAARMDKGDGDPDKEARFTVLTATRCPAVLFELEFIHTAEGAAFLTNRNHQIRMARALADGITGHFGIVATPSGPIDISSPDPAPDDLDPSAGNVAAARRHLREALKLLG